MELSKDNDTENLPLLFAGQVVSGVNVPVPNTAEKGKMRRAAPCVTNHSHSHLIFLKLPTFDKRPFSIAVIPNHDKNDTDSLQRLRFVRRRYYWAARCC